MLTSGIFQLSEGPKNYGLPASQDMLVYLNGAGAIAAALGMYCRAKLWGWSLGFVVSAAALALSLASRRHGAVGPQLEVARIGAPSLIADGLFVLLYPYVMMRGALDFIAQSREASGSACPCDASRSDRS